MLLVVLNDCVTETKDTSYGGNWVTGVRKAA